MVRWVHWLLLILCSAPLVAEPWTPAREYWGPGNREGFFQPLPRMLTSEAPSSFRSDLEVIPLNKKGFVHRSRRQAETLDAKPLLLHEAARIYAPSQSFLALRLGENALFILHPKTSVQVRPLQDQWQIDLIGERGLVRISTHQRTLAVTLKPADPQNPWQNHQLLLAPGSDFYVRYDRESIFVYGLRGYLTYRMAAFAPLQSLRPEGLLWEWERKQLRTNSKSPTEIDVFAGQELHIQSGSEYQFHIGLPQPDTWQSPLLRSSPQLAETIDPNNSMVQLMLELRKNWLQIWQGNASPSLDQATRLMAEGRWEEAYEYMKAVETHPDHEAFQIICLYRLQQESQAEKKREALAPGHPWAELLQQESLRTRLRRKARHEVKPPIIRPQTTLPGEELYLLAANEQASQRWRSALDLWERWPRESVDTMLQQSYQEWQRHLDQKKPWSFGASIEIGWSDNVLHLPSGQAAPKDMGHRSSWFIRSSQTLPYLLERSEAFSVSLEPSFAFNVYQHAGLADMQRLEPGLSLPLFFMLPFKQQSLRLKPFISRILHGTGGLDRFGYEVRWRVPHWTLAPEFSWSQDQNLDFAPTLDHRLDALSGERVGALDRSVRRNMLGLSSDVWEFMWQRWDYRFAGSEEDDRQRFMVRGSTQHELPYDFQLKIQASLHQDIFQGQRASVTGFHLRAESNYQRWYRVLPTLAMEWEMRQSGDSTQSFQETQWLGGLQYRW